ncbi:hypothetical protein EAG_12789 [Camponotus floridanus]|uniref:Uncharacterized protein n=1 Tax=Camponotus floridanus TaxID=104421 RepID=E2A5V0_CAMFO|nr:hypothetical protein EAG_12789 [Camponotus floridanus]
MVRHGVAWRGGVTLSGGRSPCACAWTEANSLADGRTQVKLTLTSSSPVATVLTESMLCDSGASMMQASLPDGPGLPGAAVRAGGGDESTVSRLGRFKAGGVMVVPAKTTGASRTLLREHARALTRHDEDDDDGDDDDDDEVARGVRLATHRVARTQQRSGKPVTLDRSSDRRCDTTGTQVADRLTERERA